MVTLNPKVSATRIDGKLCGLYLTFRPGVRAVETIPFSRADGARMNIDVDDRSIPIGMEMVAPAGISESGGNGGRSESEAAKIVVDLFAFATQMATFHRANQQARGNALIQDALQSIEQLEPGNPACA